MTLLTSVKAPHQLRHARSREAVAAGEEAVGFGLPDATSGDARGLPFRARRGGAGLPAASSDGMPLGPAARHGYAIASSAGFGMLRRAIGGVDGYLSHCCGVRPFDLDERCLLRFAVIASPGRHLLSDGTKLEIGDRVIDLHLWNEHIPPVPKGGPDLAWARLVSQWMKHSLALLAEAFDAHPDLRGARAVRAKTNFVGWGGQSESLSRLIARFGFEDVDEGGTSVPVRVHDALENILIGALTWAHNPEALRRDKLIRQRRPVWMSADTLRSRHRAG